MASDWRFNVHDDEEFAGIIDLASGRGETLLRVGGQAGGAGHVALQRVSDFAAHYARLSNLQAELEQEVERHRADAAEAREIADACISEIQKGGYALLTDRHHRAADCLQAILDRSKGEDDASDD